MMKPAGYLYDQAYLDPDPKIQGINEYYSPKNNQSKSAKKANIYPNLSDDCQYVSPVSKNSRSKKDKQMSALPYHSDYASTLPQNVCSNRDDEDKGMSTICARVYICITGIGNILAGIFLVAFALGELTGATNYMLPGEGFSTASMCVLLASGFLLVSCSIIVIIAACNHTKRHFKVALMVLSAVLVITSIIEVSIVGLSLWGHSVISRPDTHSSSIVADRVLSWSSEFSNATYLECCVASTPPYSGANATLVRGICKWPESVRSVKETCVGSNVLTCVCEKGPKRYESLFGLYLRLFLISISSVSFISAALHVAGLVAICALMHSEKQEN